MLRAAQLRCGVISVRECRPKSALGRIAEDFARFESDCQLVGSFDFLFRFFTNHEVASTSMMRGIPYRLYSDRFPSVDTPSTSFVAGVFWVILFFHVLCDIRNDAL